MASPTIDAQESYFGRVSVQTSVLGAFVFLTVPLLIASASGVTESVPLVDLYGVTFGLTHFLVTGLLYLDARNLRYFAANWQNRLIYLVVPAIILVGMDLLAVLRLGQVGDWLNGFLFYFIMLVNFLHVSRQSFGVLQLFKREGGGPYADPLRSLENLFFIALVIGQFVTFAGDGRFDANSREVWLTTGITGLLFGIVLALHAHAWVRGEQSRSARVPLVYFLFQALSGALVVYRSDWVTIALAMHYVEYHAVVMPRLFGAPVEADSRADRLRAGLARIPVLFYAGLIALAWGVWLGQRTALYADPGASPLPVRLLLHSIDGIFLFHFYVEAFLWKFSKPHYRETLGPLYFSARASS